jgi:hypothetical protein
VQCAVWDAGAYSLTHEYATWKWPGDSTKPHDRKDREMIMKCTQNAAGIGVTQPGDKTPTWLLVLGPPKLNAVASAAACRNNFGSGDPKVWLPLGEANSRSGSPIEPPNRPRGRRLEISRGRCNLFDPPAPRNGPWQRVASPALIGQVRRSGMHLRL